MRRGWISMRILEPTMRSPADPGPKSHVYRRSAQVSKEQKFVQFSSATVSVLLQMTVRIDSGQVDGADVAVTSWSAGNTAARGDDR
jgi:hypothetical protein